MVTMQVGLYLLDLQAAHLLFYSKHPGVISTSSPWRLSRAFFDMHTSNDGFGAGPPLKRRRVTSELDDTDEDVVRILCRHAPADTEPSEEFPDGFITLQQEAREINRTQYHFPNLPTFVGRLKDAYERRWPTRQTPYKQVFTLLIRWEDDDLGVEREIDDLVRMFRDTYRFDVQTWLIPSGRHRYSALIQRVSAFLAENDADEALFILYYGGHAYQDAHSQPTWVS